VNSPPHERTGPGGAGPELSRTIKNVARSLSVPAVTSADDTITAAIKYAEAGWYVGYVNTASRNPKSPEAMARRWQDKTTRDPAVIAMMFAGTDRGIFLHAGRSGAVIVDVDTPEKLHPDLAQVILDLKPPKQSTRPDQPGRCHYIFAQPAGRSLGNSVGSLGSGWGEIRGKNGVIVVAPTVHAEGGLYQWLATGDVPELPPSLSEQLPDALAAVDAADDYQVTTFLTQHTGRSRTELLDIHVQAYRNKCASGESRHDSMNGHLAGAMKEAKAGFYGAQIAADTLQSVFLEEVAKTPHGKQKSSRTGAAARNEWRGLLAWAVAQASASDSLETQARVAEKVPDLTELVVSVDADTRVSADDATEAALDAAAAFAREVDREAFKLRVRDAAQRKVKAARSGETFKPTFIGLDEFSAIEFNEQPWRIDQLMRTGSRIVVAAQYKAGKSTLVGNTVRSLADAVPFLDKFDTEPARVALIDNELHQPTLQQWLDDQAILNQAAVRLMPLRGRTGSFDILDPAIRTEWAEALADQTVDVVVFDCLRPVLDALGLSEDKDAGRFLVAFDALLTEADVSEGIVVHHMGHSGERSRGDSRILDWPDATWKLVRQEPDDPGSARYFSAFGRDVDQPEGRLEFDPLTRRLSLIGGSRKESAGEEVIEPLLELLDDNTDGLSGRKVEEALMPAGYTKAAIRSALKAARERELTVQVPGKQNAIIHRLNPSAPSAPEVRQRTSEECASAPIGRAHTHSVEASEPLAHSPDFYDLFNNDPAVTLVERELGAVVISEEVS